jgi:hypothetical protein
MGHGGDECMSVRYAGRGGDEMVSDGGLRIYKEKGMGKVYDRGKQAKKKVEPTGAIVGVNRGISKKSKKVLGVRWVKKKWYKEVKRREGWVAASRDREMHRA